MRQKQHELDEDERRIHKIALEWVGTIKEDPVFDLDDLLQDLRWRYWKFQKEHLEKPRWNLMRNWARKEMRKYGYVGGNCAEYLRSEPRMVRVGNSRAVSDPDIDVTDEEMLDYMAIHKTGRANNKWIPEE